MDSQDSRKAMIPSHVHTLMFFNYAYYLIPGWRSNYFGTCFTIYDDGRDPRRNDDIRGENIRRELGIIKYVRDFSSLSRISRMGGSGAMGLLYYIGEIKNLAFFKLIGIAIPLSKKPISCQFWWPWARPQGCNRNLIKVNWKQILVMKFSIISQNFCNLFFANHSSVLKLKFWTNIRRFGGKSPRVKRKIKNIYQNFNWNVAYKNISQ